MTVQFWDIKRDDCTVFLLCIVQKHHVLFSFLTGMSKHYVLVRPLSCGEKHSELLRSLQPRPLLLSLM